MTTNLDALVERLRGPLPNGRGTLRDLHTEAASELSALKQDMSFVWKWVERALFDKTIGRDNALKTLAHYPGAPWKNGRWDVDHKEYSKAFYAEFPKALTPENGK